MRSAESANPHSPLRTPLSALRTESVSRRVHSPRSTVHGPGVRSVECGVRNQPLCTLHSALRTPHSGTTDCGLFPSVGQAWVSLVKAIVQKGAPMGSEGLELLGVSVGFPAAVDRDPVLERFGDARMIGAMKGVFFGAEPG